MMDAAVPPKAEPDLGPAKVAPPFCIGKEDWERLLKGDTGSDFFGQEVKGFALQLIRDRLLTTSKQEVTRELKRQLRRGRQRQKAQQGEGLKEEAEEAQEEQEARAQPIFERA